MRTLRILLAGLCAGAVSLAALAPAASARTLVEQTLGAAGTHAAACTDALGGNGTVTRSFTSPDVGYLSARLDGGRGDWDLAIFSDRSGEPVAGGAAPGPDEVATGYALPGEKLTAQACRRSGAGGSPTLTIDFTGISEKPTPAPSLLRVSTPTVSDRVALEQTGLDLSESVGPDFVDVVAYGDPDLEKLSRIGLPYSVRTGNLIRQSRRDRAAELASAGEASASASAAGGLPSGRTGTYRRLFDYEEELKQLAHDYPNMVRLFSLPEKTYEGRKVMGIEIARNAGVRNGKPIFMQMGVHHAREWPAGEHALEWAYELLEGYKAGDRRDVQLVRKIRTVIVPIVNPDGFNASREAGELEGAAGGRSAASDTAETVNIVTHPNEYRRKNCRYADGSEGGSCIQPAFGVASIGVDPNRNYGGLWGGPGASSDPTAEDYRGPGPFSEPETRNIQDFISQHQVTAFVTNHTFSGLWLRPPGVASFGEPIDESVFRKLGAKATRENGYANIPGYQLYDTTGSTEDWAYGATGALGYTAEIGARAFHPAYDEMIAEWNGTSADFDARGGNRAAYYHVANFVRRKASHAVIRGKGPKRGRVILKKRFLTETSPVLDVDGGTPGDVIRFKDKLRTVARIRIHGRFRFDINPSTRPVVALAKGVKNAGSPSKAQHFSGTATTATPCGDAETDDPSCWNDHPIVIPDQPGRDNAEAVVRIDWGTPASDWDMKLFVDSDGDGSSAGETEQVGMSANGPTTFEQATIADLEPGQKYVARIVNFAAVEDYEGTVSFLGPEPYQPALKERWRLVVKNRKHNVVRRRKLYIERGQIKRLDLRRRHGKRKHH